MHEIEDKYRKSPQSVHCYKDRNKSKKKGLHISIIKGKFYIQKKNFDRLKEIPAWRRK